MSARPGSDVQRYTCPCCGYKVFSSPPGTDEICPVCDWQDDASSLRYALMPDGPNDLSLVDAQSEFANVGHVLPQFLVVPKAGITLERDLSWRPIDPERDVIDRAFDGPATEWPADLTRLYYWLPTYWLGTS